MLPPPCKPSDTMAFLSDLLFIMVTALGCQQGLLREWLEQQWE